MPRDLCFQGGGVYVLGGTVTFSSCTITGNTVSRVRAHAQNFPDWKMADMPKSTLIFRFWIDIWFYQGYVRASHACKLPIAPMGNADALALILACITANDASVNYRGCVLKRP